MEDSGQSSSTVQADIRHMRSESWQRAAFICLISASLTSLIFGSSWTTALYDLVLPLGPPISHFVNALFLFGTLLIIVVQIDIIRTRIIIKQGRDVSEPVAEAVRQLAQNADLSPEISGFGGPSSDGIEAVAFGRRHVIRIGTLRERQAVVSPNDFKFAIAHEIAHLASDDPKADRIVKAAYMVGGLFMISSVARVMFNLVKDTVALSVLDFATLMFVLQNAFPSLLANLLAFGTLAAFMFIETRSARRLREFHADAVARDLLAVDASYEKAIEPITKTREMRFLDGLIANHPSQDHRSEAINRIGVAFSADQVMFALQSYFSATILEISLQLLFVMASPNITTLAKRREHLEGILLLNPTTIVLILFVASLLVTISQYLVIQRFHLMARNTGSLAFTPKLLGRVLGLALFGVLLALATSQTVYWELSQSEWNLMRWVEADPDRVTLHATLFLTSGCIMFAGLTLTKCVESPIVRILMSAAPVSAVWAAALYFYG